VLRLSADDLAEARLKLEPAILGLWLEESLAGTLPNKGKQMFQAPIHSDLKADVLDAAPALIAVHDTDHNIVWANKAYLKTTGLSLQEIEGKKCYSVWRLGKPCRGCPVTLSIEDGEPHEAELTPQNQDHWPISQGSWLSKSAPLKDAEGRVIVAVETAYDITDRKRAEDALKQLTTELATRIRQRTAELDEAGAVLRIAFDHSPIGKALVAPDGRFLNGNAALCRILGYSKEELLTKTFQEVTHPDDLEADLANVKQVLAGEIDTYEMEKRYLHNGGNLVWAQLNVSLVRDSAGQPLFFIAQIQDLTKRKQAEKEQEELRAQFMQAQKMEAVGRLAGGVAHDYNNMLSVIIGYSELSIDKMEPENPLRDDLKEILNAADRAKDITRQLLAFARRETIAPEVLDLNATVKSFLKLLRRLIGEDIDLAWNPGAGLWRVKLDPAQVDQILANLCVNARDAISGVGKITVETKNIIFDEAYCAIHAGFKPGEFVMLAVSDDGHGMDKEIRDKIFEPFFTTKPLGQGTGLGLGTVYGVVKQNGGFINVYSEPDKGTTFHLYLPRHVGKAAKVQKQRTAEIPYGHGETILVVEDEVSILNLTRKMLEELGYSVLTAGRPGDALQLAEEHAGKIDLLITDVVMPEMNGKELAERLRGLYPALKYLFMSGYTANVIAHHGILDEGIHFIQKPVSKKDLAAKVREALEKSG
jgi:two-component system sensor histidine kinase EvgS